MARYRDAIEWLAHNDPECTAYSAEGTHGVSIYLVADVWGKASDDVAKDVLKEQAKAQKERGK